MIAVVAVLAAAALVLPQDFADPERLAVVLAATAALAIVGVIDDTRPIEPGRRFSCRPSPWLP